jgi:hypothetical protein
MPVEKDWGDHEETLIVMKIRGDWDAAQLLSTQEEVRRLAETKPHPVDVIVDMRAASMKMNGLLSLARRAIQIIPENLGYVAVITSTLYWSQIYRVLPDELTELLHVGFVDDVDAAYAAINRHRSQHSQMTDDTLA